MRVHVCLAVSALFAACTPQGDPGIGPAGFRDDFERQRIEDEWNATGPQYRIRDGALRVQGAQNHPLWLRRTLPADVRISFDVTSFSPDGDIKVELFGDGVSHAIPSVPRYTSTGYVVIFGGWQNSRNVIARMDEHAPDRVEGPRKRVVQGRSYHFEIVREGGLLTVSIDGEELMRMDDPAPLRGRGHDHFAFNNWNSDVLFDNLEISPL